MESKPSYSLDGITGSQAVPSPLTTVGHTLSHERKLKMSKTQTVFNFFSITLLSVIYLCLAPPCFAENFTTPGGYIIVSGLTGFENFKDTGVDDFKDAWGLGIRIGNRFNEQWSLEGDLGMMNGFDATVDLSEINPDLSGTEKIILDTLLLTANLKAHWPLGRFEPYALVGAGIMYVRVRSADPTGYVCWPSDYGWYCRGTYSKINDAAEFVTKFGFGSEIHIDDQWAITLDLSYVVPYSDLSDMTYTLFSWGFRHAF